MASIFKRSFKSKDGTRRKRKFYTIKFKELDGKFHTVKGSPEEDKSQSLGKKLDVLVYLRLDGDRPDLDLVRWIKGLSDERQNELVELGLIDRDIIGMDRRAPLTDHLEAYVQDLEATGRDDKYCYNVKKRLIKLFDECGWDSLQDIDPNGFVTWRSARKGRKAAKMLNDYLAAATAFLNWCERHNRCTDNPLVPVAIIDARGKTKRKRRAIPRIPNDSSRAASFQTAST